MCFGSYTSRKKGYDAVTPVPETGKIELKFKIGDTVKITRKAAGGENGWRNVWNSEMNLAVGKIGEIQTVSQTRNEYQIKISGVSYNFWYPQFILETVTETPVFKIGDRVNVSYDGSGYWDGPATVRGIYATGDVSVETDKRRVGAFSPDKLTLIAPPVLKTPENYQYKVGDRVQCNYGSATSRWRGPGTVTGFSSPFVYVKLDHRKKGPYSSTGAFYAHEIALITPAPSVTSEPKTKFQVGDRVRVTAKRGGPYVGITSTVVKIEPSGYSEGPYYILKPDGIDSRPGYYASNLELALTKPSSASQAVSHPSQLYEIAKNIAIDTAKTNGFVNADLVQDGLAKLGYTPSQLGNAAGSLFRSKKFEKIGAVKSTRPGNNRREIFNYRYIGA